MKNHALSTRTLPWLCLALISGLTIGLTKPAKADTILSYSLTTQNDPVAPGHVLEFDAVVTNLSAVSQSVRLDFVVPQYTTYGGLHGGQSTYYNFGSVAAGGSVTAKLRFVVNGTDDVPPDGTVISLTVTDVARQVAVTHTAVVQSAPVLSLQLSTEQGTVAPGGNFTYTLATANLSGASLSGTTLSATVPQGASFVSADGGGVLNGNTITWNLGTLAVGGNVQVHATFQASSAANASLTPLEAVVSDNAGHVARASDVRVVYAAPLFSYVLTAIPDSTVPGHVLEYDLTVTNLSSVGQSVRLDFTVPEYTTYGSLGGGSFTYYNFGVVAAGASATGKLQFVVVGSGNIPLDGTTITLNGIDLARGASISRSAVVRALPALTLQLSTEQGTVAPGGNFVYTLATANVSSGSLVNTVLSAAIPTGASFVSADHGGRLQGGVITWKLGTLGASTNVRVNATFKVAAATKALGPLDAIVSDRTAHVARASDIRTVYAAPTFSYNITGMPDPVAPGQVLEYDVMVTNTTTDTQSVRVDFTVPEYTTYGGLNGGAFTYYNFGSVAAGASTTAQLFFTVVGSGSIPPDGTSITLDPIDLARGASVSRTVVVDSIAP